MVIDDISIQKAGGHNLVSPSEWLALPLGERVDLIGAKKVTFLSEGAPVPVKEALAALRVA